MKSFLEFTERIKAKNIWYLESFFKARTNKIFVYHLLELVNFRSVSPGANFFIFNFVSEDAVRV